MDMNNVNIEEIVKQVLSGKRSCSSCCTKRSGCSGRKRNSEKSKSSNDDREETF